MVLCFNTYSASVGRFLVLSPACCCCSCTLSTETLRRPSEVSTNLVRTPREERAVAGSVVALPWLLGGTRDLDLVTFLSPNRASSTRALGVLWLPGPLSFGKLNSFLALSSFARSLSGPQTIFSMLLESLLLVCDRLSGYALETSQRYTRRTGSYVP